MPSANFFVDSGLSSALIRKLDRTELDYSTAFYFNIAIALVCYLILYISAPDIADFYKQRK
ncbi:oligosaccharide flippase family protein [Providencia hangzhouensis]